MNKWEIYLAYVKYEDIPGGKLRPVLIIDNTTVYPVSCLKMTSQPPRNGEYTLTRWQAAGLKKPTTVRIQKRLSLDAKDFKKKLGSLDPVDIVNLENMIQES